eukprot:5521771-Pyramimonas_sp.AAC.1
MRSTFLRNPLSLCFRLTALPRTLLPFPAVSSIPKLTAVEWLELGPDKAPSQSASSLPSVASLATRLALSGEITDFKSS